MRRLIRPCAGPPWRGTLRTARGIEKPRHTRDGEALVQVYVRDVAASVTRPDRRLAAWAHVPVPAGGSAEAELTLDPELLELIDAEGRRVVEPGLFHALVGFNSQVNRLIELPFEVRPVVR